MNYKTNAKIEIDESNVFSINLMNSPLYWNGYGYQGYPIDDVIKFKESSTPSQSNKS